MTDANNCLKNRFFSHNYSCFILIFILACVTKWFYLAYRNYYIALPDSLPTAYLVAKQYSIVEILKRLFLDYDYKFMEYVDRPFVVSFLYIIGFKLGGFYPRTVFLLNIFFSSLLTPLYYLIIQQLLNTEVALFSSLSLLFLTNHIQQSLALNSILTGIVFLAFSLLFIIDYYISHRLWKLYLSGLFLAISSLCRVELVLFIPFFILYNLLFDRKAKGYLRIIYWVIRLSGITYICLSNFKLSGNPFLFIDNQNIAGLSGLGGPIGFLKASILVRNILSNKFAGWLILAMGLGGICFTIIKNKALILISSVFVYFPIN